VAKPESGVALRYMQRFQCIGSACEDNCCCQPWRVTLDQKDYARLKRTLSGSQPEREWFARGCRRSRKQEPGRSDYAALQKRRDGACVFLGADQLCSIHATRGAAELPKVCATYPRIVSRLPDRLELAGTLSCPEAARLCLLAEDGVELDEVDPRGWEGLLVHTSQPARSRDPYVRYFLPVRDAFLGLLAAREYPLASRFFFAACLAQRLGAFFFKRAPPFQGARLFRELTRFRTPSTLARLDRKLASREAPAGLPFALVQQILLAALTLRPAPRFAALLEQVYAPYLREESPDARLGRGTRTLLGGELWEDYRARRDRWERRLGDRIALYLGNYAANYWMKECYTGAPDLLTHCLRLQVRVAMLRFLLFEHPAIRAVVGDDAPERGEQPLLDRIVVEVIYTFSRAIEHTPAFLHEVHKVLRRNGIRRLDHAVQLLKF